MPSLRIRPRSVLGFRPSASAAPCSPSITQRLWSSTRWIWRRSTSSRVPAAGACAGDLRPRRSGRRAERFRRVEQRSARKNRRALDDVLELAHVARPVVARRALEKRRRDARERLAELAPGLGEEVADEQRDVLAPLAQRRHGHREDVEPIVEIGPELAGRGAAAQVAVRRSDQPHVGAQRARAADALELLLLQHAQQLRLRFERQLAHLVEEQRAAVGELEAPAALLGRAGERALLVPEELALDQFARERGAVDLDERPLAARAAVVDRARDELLAGAGLAEHEHRALGRRDERELIEQPREARRPSHDLAEVVPGPDLVLEAVDDRARALVRLDLLPQARVLLLELALGPTEREMRADPGEQLARLERLGEVVDAAGGEGAHLLERLVERGEEDHRHVARGRRSP